MYNGFLLREVRISLRVDPSTIKITDQYTEEEKKALSKLKLRSLGDEFFVTWKEFFTLEQLKVARLVQDYYVDITRVINRERMSPPNVLSKIDNKYFYIEIKEWFKRLDPIEDREVIDLVRREIYQLVTKRLSKILRLFADKNDELTSKLTIEELNLCEIISEESMKFKQSVILE